MANEPLDQVLRAAVMAKVCANDEIELTLSGVIDDVFSEKQEIPRYRVREAVLDLLYDQQLVHDASGIVRLARIRSGETVLCR